MSKKDNKKKKLLEIYAKASTPQELFVDAIEKIDEFKKEFKEKTTNLDSTLQYVIENKPKTDEEMALAQQQRFQEMRARLLGQDQPD